MLTGAPLPARFPAHLHINLLAHARGRGLGRLLLETLLAELRAAGAGGVHLGVARSNTGGQAFYRALGLSLVEERPDTLILGRALEGAGP